MGWFNDQIHDRKLNDQELFEDSLFSMASVVLGRRGAGALGDERVVTKAAIDDILKYFGCKPVEVPESVTEPDEQLEYCLRPHGLMCRTVSLTEGWQKDAFGPMLACRGEEKRPTVLLPGQMGGYCFKDEGGRRVPVTRKQAGAFWGKAICFYRPLPLRRIGISDLFAFLGSCLCVGDYLLLAGLTLLVVLVGMLTPNLTRLLTGFVLESGNTALLWETFAFLVCVLISSQLVQSVRAVAMNRLEIKTSMAVQSAMMMRLMSLPAPFFKRYSSGELSSRSKAVDSLCSLLMGTVFSTGLMSVCSLLYITQIVHFAPGLVVPALTVILATVALTLLTSLVQARVSGQAMEFGAKESGVSFALISGITKIRLAGAEKRAFARWAGAYTAGAELSYNPPFFLKINGALNLLISLLGTLALYYFSVQTGISQSEYMAFGASYGMVMGAFSALAGIASSIAQIRPVLDMAKPLLEAEPEVSESREIVTRLSGGIELSNVCFRYREDMPYVVDGINLKIRPGEYIAIVGATGCGKSTLMRLMLGFETPEKGAIYYDGRNMNKLDLRSLRRRIGTVMQDGGLFEGDIYSNITISAPQLTLEDAWAAAETAGIADDIRRMPMQMFTMLGEGQGGISGGQKQRLMIARAIAPKPKILMFDEATSALDNKTQKQISEALDQLKCTRIVIAHRLSTIRNCNRILLLDKGHILEDGTYDELIAKGGAFAELVARQWLDATD